VRVKLLSERLLAWRDTQGRYALIDEFCAHRGTSLWVGRNEENGLRCPYHGWKYDHTGQCIDVPSEPVESGFCKKIKLKSYPLVKRGDVLWAYMGPPEKQPPLPEWEFATVPSEQSYISKRLQECNWLQALEGGIDTSHAPILHRALRTTTNRPGIDPRSPFVRGGPPLLEVDLTEYGYRYAGVRQMPEGGKYVRAYHYVMPFTQLRPASLFGAGKPSSFTDSGPGHFWVPMDDQTVMVWNFMYSLDERGITDEDRREYGNGNGPDHVNQDTFRAVKNLRNNWGIDRSVQKTDTYSGIEGVNTQDRAVQESMGPVVDRSQEYLGPADKAIIAMRRLLLAAVKTVQNGGDPPATDDSYHHIRAVERMLPDGAEWRDTILPLMYPTATTEAERELVAAS
jgi:phenylpropionate dioxygenase-like ring-hydroxylating dioxygenase large terminal subunit